MCVGMSGNLSLLGVRVKTVPGLLQHGETRLQHWIRRHLYQVCCLQVLPKTRGFDEVSTYRQDT